MIVLTLCATLGIFEPELRQQAAAASPLSPSAVVVPNGEPGVPLAVAGRILAKDGKPAAHAKVYVYQTDDKGYYSPNGGDERNPRLKAHLRTDDQGRYTLRTIRPGPYPNSGPPAHIHYEVTKDGGAIDRFELVFDDDARLTEAIRRDAAARGEYAICKPQKEGAGLRCEGADFYLK